MHPHDWSDQDHLLAGIFDALSIANWQRSGDKRAARPKPLPRPGAEEPGRIGTAIPLADMKVMARKWMAGELAGKEREQTRVR